MRLCLDDGSRPHINYHLGLIDVELSRPRFIVLSFKAFQRSMRAADLCGPCVRRSSSVPLPMLHST